MKVTSPVFATKNIYQQPHRSLGLQSSKPEPYPLSLRSILDFRWLLFLLLWATSNPLIAIDTTLSQLPQKPSPWGNVIDPSGNAVAGVNLLILPMFEAEGEHIALSSNLSGKFSTIGPPPKRPKDDYVVWKHPSYATWGRGHINIDQFGADQPFEVKLKKPYPFEGRVIDSKGKGIPGANITLDADLPCGGHTHNFKNLVSKLSHQEGAFRFTQLPDGATFRILATHPKFTMPERKTFINSTNSESSSNLVLTLLPSQPLLIDLVEPLGQTIPLKTFQFGFSSNKLESFGGLNQKTSTFNAISDHKGEAKLQGPKKGFLHLRFNFKSHDEKDVINLSLSPWKDLQVTLSPKMRLSFQVVDQMSRKPIDQASLRVSFKHPTESYETNENGKSDSKGLASLFLPSIKKTVVHAWADGYVPKELKLLPKDNETVLIELEQGIPSTFIIQQPLPHGASALIPNRSVKIEHRFNPSGSHRRSSRRRSGGRELRKVDTLSDEKGRLSFGGFQKGDDLKFQVKGYVSKTLKAPVPGDDLHILLQPGSSPTIRVQDETENEIKGPRFYLQSGGQETHLESKYNAKKRHHVITPLSADTHTIIVKESQYQDEKLVIEVVPNQSNQSVVTLRSKPEITLRLKGIGEKAPTQIQVQFKNSMGQKQGSRVTKIKDASIPSFKCQPYQDPTDYREMLVTAQNFLPATLPINFSKQDTYDIVLKPGLSLSALISSPDGTAIKGAEVSIIEMEPWRQHRQKTDDKGKVEMSGLQKGLARIKITKKGFAPFNLDSQEIQEDMPLFQWTLDRGIELNVKVVDQSQLPLQDVRIKLFSQSQWGGFRPHNTGDRPPLSDDSGLVSFQNLSQGTYQVQGSSDLSGIGESKPFALKKGQKETITLLLKQGLNISGTVVNEFDIPIPDVLIRANLMMDYSSRRSQKAESDDDGRFALNNLPKGVYSIHLQHDEYDNLSPNFQVEAGKDDIRLKMKSLQNWKVRVLMPNGDPTTQAKLHLFIPQWRGTSPLNQLDVDGDSYVMTSRDLRENQNPDMEFKIVATFDGFSPGQTETLNLKNMSDLDILLAPSITRKLIITNGEGLAIEKAKAKVNQVLNGKEVHHNNNSENLSDESGEISLKGLKKGLHRILVEHGDHASKSLDIDIQESEGSVQIVLTKGGRISGQVLDHESNPRQGAHLWITKENGQKAQRGESVSGPNGRFIIKHLEEGTYTLQLTTKKRSWKREVELKHPFSIMNGEDVEINLQLKAPEPMGGLTGQIKEGSFFQYASLSGRMHQQGQQHQAPVRDQTFHFKDIPVGEYSLMVVGEKGSITRKVIIQEGVTTELNLGENKKYRIVGKIEKSNGDPLLLGSAMFLRPDRPFSMKIHGNPDVMVSMTKIEAGYFEFELDEHGTFDLIVNESGSRGMDSAFVFNHVTVINQEETDLGILKCPPSQSQKVIILDPSGQALQGAYASIVQDNIPIRNHSWVSNTKGEIMLEKSKNSPYILLIQHPEYAPFKKTINHVNPVDVTLSFGQNISISLPEFPNTKVDLANEEKEPFHLGMEFFRKPSLLLDSQGNLKWNKMPSGRYRLRLFISGGEIAFTESFEVGPGQPQEIRLVLAPSE